jgi:hypothetical protein
MRGAGKLRRGWRAVAGIAVAGLLLAGCNVIDGGPPRLFSVAYEADLARGRLTTAEDAYYAIGGPRSKGIRNEIISTRMREIDSYYFAFEASLIRERQEIGFVTSIVAMALSGAVPLVSSIGTKNALGAASLAVQGGTKAFSDEVLFQKTVQVLATQMRARRDFIASDIITRMRTLDLDTYPLSMALGDLDEYYAAGTIAGALIEIQKTVSAESKIAEDAKTLSVVRVSYTTDAAKEAILNFWMPGGVINQANETKLRIELAKITPLRLARIMNGAENAAIRVRLAKALGLL